MKEYIEQILEDYSNRDIIYRRNILKEYLQENILYIICRSGFSKNLIFEGGTALRFLFNIKRFSEDLDFSMPGTNLNIENFTRKLKRELELMNYKIEIKEKGEKTVKRIFFKFPGLLYSYKLSEQKEQKVSVLVEIDEHPPEGGKSETSIISKQYIFRIKHYSIPSLMAKKISAVFTRPFDKGRDYYDLLWFLRKEVEPDFELLNRAIKQVGEEYPVMDKNNWQTEILRKLKMVNFRKIRDGVRNFLEIRDEADMIQYKTFEELLGNMQ